jgi:hypothetical protein
MRWYWSIGCLHSPFFFRIGHHQAGDTAKEIFYLPEIHKMAGFATSAASLDLTGQLALLNFESTSPGAGTSTVEVPLGPINPVDLVHIVADLDGLGAAKWVIGLGTNRVLVVKYAGTNAPTAYVSTHLLMNIRTLCKSNNPLPFTIGMRSLHIPGTIRGLKWKTDRRHQAAVRELGGCTTTQCSSVQTMEVGCSKSIWKRLTSQTLLEPRFERLVVPIQLMHSAQLF